MSTSANPLTSGLRLGGQAQVQRQTKRPLYLQGKSTTGFGGGMSLSSEDQQHVEQVKEKHDPDDTLHVDVRPLLHLVQDILTNATAQTNAAEDATDQAKGVQQKHESLDSKMVLSGFEDIPDMPIIVERLSCEMSGKCSGELTDAHEVTLSVLKTISRFNWDAKLVLTLAAFALSYGELWLLAQTYSTNRLAKSMGLLKQVPRIIEQDDSLKGKFEAIYSLIKAMLDVTEMVVDFKESHFIYLSQDEASMKQFPLSVYWTIRSAVSAATQITVLTSSSHEYMPSTNEMELSNWTQKLKAICERLRKIKDAINEFMDVKVVYERHTKIKNSVYHGFPSDIMTVLEMLIRGEDDTLIPLHDCSRKERVHTDIFRGKTVLLLISSLDIPTEGLSLLGKIYTESMTRKYEIIWLPIVDPTIPWNALQDKFEKLQAMMQWYSVYHLSIMYRAVIRFFREDLNFKGEPLLAGLDAKGKLINPNAMPMMWIWGKEAFPFTTAREETLWTKADWNLDLLVTVGSNMDDPVQTWMEGDKYIFLCGGDDIDWIRRFTSEARTAAGKSNIGNIEFLYVGKSCKTVDGLQKIISTIKKEKLCTHVFDTSDIWYFWTRIQSMLHSKIQLDKVDDISDIVAIEIKKLISYDKIAFGTWALFAKGSKVKLSGPGSTIYKALQEFDKWEIKLGFEHAFITYHRKIYLEENPCCRFEFPTGSGKIPESLKCPMCNSTMQNPTTFICCHEGADAVPIRPLAN